MLDADYMAAVSGEAARIVRSGALGRSRSYARLLEFLVECAREGRTPKELEIAMEVFGKGADFDPSQDSLVRVYAHNLRQKLEQYYAQPERASAGRLLLARGEYRIHFVGAGVPVDSPAESDTAAAAAAGAGDARATPVAPAVAATFDAVGSAAATAGSPAASASPTISVAPVPTAAAAPAASMAPPSRSGWLAAAAAALLAVGIALGWAIGANRDEPVSAAVAVARSPVWAPLFDDNLPLLVVVGDYYIFGELGGNGEVARLVREFDVNSSRELDELMMFEPDLLDRYMDLDLTYLPRGSAFALLDVLRVLYTTDKPIRVVSMSELNVAELKSNHLIYIGYLSGLDKLEDFVFASSSLAIGDTYDELRNKTSGELYSSEGGAPGIDRNYRDYSFVSSFPGPSGNQVVIVAGTRDAGLMQSAHALSDPGYIHLVEQALPDGNARSFEQLYEVMGFNRTNLDARLVHKAQLNYAKIWGGSPLTSE